MICGLLKEEAEDDELLSTLANQKKKND